MKDMPVTLVGNTAPSFAAPTHAHHVSCSEVSHKKQNSSGSIGILKH